MLQVSIDTYIAEIKMTNRRILLSEGKSDEVALRKLIIKYCEFNGIVFSDIRFQFDTAERIKENGILYNREKIETVLLKIKSKPYEKKIVAFLDREFQEFLWDTDLEDLLKCHKQEGQSVWSRGHSLENYFFDPLVLKESIFELSNEDHSNSIQLFLDLLDKSINIACAISLATLNIGQHYNIPNVFERIASSLSFDSNIVEIKNTALNLNFSTWNTLLDYRLNDEEIVEYFITVFKEYLVRIESNPNGIARWLCHGHIGTNFLAIVYAQCFFNYYGSILNEQTLLNVNHDIKLAVVVAQWANLSFTQGLEYPKELLELLFQDII